MSIYLVNSHPSAPTKLQFPSTIKTHYSLKVPISLQPTKHEPIQTTPPSHIQKTKTRVSKKKIIRKEPPTPGRLSFYLPASLPPPSAYPHLHYPNKTEEADKTTTANPHKSSHYSSPSAKTSSSSPAPLPSSSAPRAQAGPNSSRNPLSQTSQSYCHHHP